MLKMNLLIILLNHVDFNNIPDDLKSNVIEILKHRALEALLETNYLCSLTNNINHFFDYAMNNMPQRNFNWEQYNESLRKKYEDMGIFVSDTPFQFKR